MTEGFSIRKQISLIQATDYFYCKLKREKLSREPFESVFRKNPKNGASVIFLNWGGGEGNLEGWLLLTITSCLIA